MPSSLTSFAVTCVVLALIQALAALPWILAINPLTRRRLCGIGFLSKFLGGTIVLGALAAFFLDSNVDPSGMTTWGRWYMAAIHLQLGADLFVLAFFMMLQYWPKGGAVALAAFQEGVRQPMYWFLGGAAILLMGISPVIPFFTFGEDLKMVKELCYAFTMLAPAIFAVIAASISVSEEIEGRTAITLMSKPVSRRQFLLGKFGGVFLAALFMTIILGWVLVWIVLLKQVIENPLASPGGVYVEPRWVLDMIDEYFSEGGSSYLLKGVGFWVNDAGEAAPSLIIGFCQVMVLLAVAVALATRLPMIVTVPACLFVYFFGHLTPIMTEVARGGNALVFFVAQLFNTVLPGLDLFDVGSSITRDFPLPLGAYFLYAGNVALYALGYTAIALLFGLVLFEDRDLA